MIITRSNESVNVGKKTARLVFTIGQGKKVVKASSKQRVLKLSPRRVMHGGLFNNPTLVATLTTGSAICTVGVKLPTCERKYEVPVVWKADLRGKMRRYITKADFLALPQVLQDIAITNGVNINSGRITFSRCVVAWAGHQVKDMHVHHVNMCTTDDRLANLWVMTPSEHAAIHADATDLLYDKDWYEYTSHSVLQLRLDELYTLTAGDIADPLPSSQSGDLRSPSRSSDYSISDEELAAMYQEAPSFEETMARMQVMFDRAGIVRH